MKNLPIKAILLAIFCNLLFGSASPFIKLGYEYFSISGDTASTITYAGIRFFISGIIVFIIDAAMTKKLPKIPRDNARNIIFTALTYTFLQYTFFYIGLSHTTGASASVINASSAFMSVILAHFIYKDDRINTKKIIGCMLGFVGVVIACFGGADLAKPTLFGEGFILLTALLFVIGSVFNKKASGISNSFTVTAYNLLIGGALLILLGFSLGNVHMVPTVKGVAVLGYLVFVSSAGFTIWSMLLRKYPIGKLGVFNFIIPVSGAVLSGLFLGENIFTLQYLFATVLVAFGIFVLNFKFANKE